MALALGLGTVAGCTTGEAPPPSGELRILLSEKARTLNPRHASDPTGQRVGAVLFRALTRLDADLEPRPDLASSWRAIEGGRRWEFRIAPGLRDQGGEPVTAERVAACLEQYRVGQPVSLHAGAFPHWTGTEARADSVTIRLARPDPYLARNVSLLRYFRGEGSVAPCAEPAEAQVIGSGEWRMERWEATPAGDFTLLGPEGRRARLLFVRDDTTLALRLLRGDVHVTQNSLSLPKTAWLKRAHGERFVVREREGVNVSYLAFNLGDPVMARREVRRAIAHAIDRDEIVAHKLFGFCTRADSLLSPRLSESRAVPLNFDPAESARLLDAAGFPRPPGGGPRLRLRYRTQPYRDSLELARVFREQLGRVGIDLAVEVVEPAAFQAALRRGDFQLVQSRWVGVADGSLLYRTLHSGQPLNRAGFRDAATDGWLDAATVEADSARRAELLGRVQARMLEELPYFPLWTWNNAVVARRELAPQAAALEISLSGALQPLLSLRP